MNTHTKITTPPEWAATADRTSDEIENWVDLTGEDEDECIAYFKSDGYGGFVFGGFHITEAPGTSYYISRDELPQTQDTIAAIWRMEQYEMQAASDEPPDDGSDDAYDNWRADRDAGI